MSIFYGFVIFCLFAGTSEQFNFTSEIPSFCPEQKTFSAFNETKHIGTWYSNGVFNRYNASKSHCNTEHWSAVQKGEFAIIESWLGERYGKKRRRISTVRVSDLSKPERFNVTSDFPNSVNHTRRILETDYTSYTIQYFCSFIKSYKGQHFLLDYILIMTRERNPPEAVIEKAIKFVRDSNLSTESYVKTNQTGCEILDEKSNMDEGDKNRAESQEITTSSSSTIETLLPLATIGARSESGNATLD